MKITETIERECCQPSKDFKKFKGKLPTGYTESDNVKFCEHCGQLWHWTRSPGEMDYGYERIN